MDKILVKLYIPIIEEKFDMWIPVNKKIYNIIKLFIKVIKEKTGEDYNPKEMPMLYDKITGKEYDINSKVIETNIRNGSEIILI